MFDIHLPYLDFLTRKYGKADLLIRLGTLFLVMGVFFFAILWLTVTPIQAQSGSISIAKFAPLEVKAGEPFTYTIRVLNSGTYNLNVDISDPIPANVTVVDPGSGTFNNGAIEWSSLSIDPFDFVEVSFSVVVIQTGNVINADYEATSGSNTEFGSPVTTTVKPNDPAIITIDSDPNPIIVNGSANLTISVTDLYSNPVEDGTAVSLDFDKGTVDGQSPGTTINGVTSGGQMVKTLSAGTVAGTANLTATAGSTQGTADVVINPGSPASLVVLASPDSISTVGGQSATITASVADQYGNEVTETPVTFTTSLGKLNGSGASVVVNTSSGQAIATLAGTVAGTATLTVTVGSLVDASQNVYLASGPPTQIQISASPKAIVANGVSTSTLTLLIRDENSNLVDTPVPITITTSAGTLTGGGTIYTDTPNNGRVQITLTAITKTSLANVHVLAASLSTDTGVNFVAGPPAKASLEANPTILIADGSSTADLTVTVRDAYDNLVSTPTAVTFAVGEGTLLDPATDTTTDGVVVNTLRSSTVLGNVPITVTVDGIASSVTGNVEFIAGPPSSVDISLVPTSPITVGIPVDLTLTVRDNVGHILPNVPITITSSLGSITPSFTGTTNSSGQLQRTLFSTQAGTGAIGVSSHNGNLTVNGGSVIFLPDEAVQATLSANPTQIVADGVSTSQITALLTDRYGNPVPGETPKFSTTLGSLSGNDSTNASGVTTRILQSSTTLDAAIITISDLTTVTNTTVNFITGPPASAVLVANPTTVQAGQNVTLVITVTDSVGHPITEQSLAVTSSLGSVSGCSNTDSQGKLTCTLNSTQSGQPDVYVAGIPTTGDTVTFVPGDLHHIHVTPYGTTGTPVNASAGSPLTFSAIGHDFYHNQITGLSFVWSKDSYGGDGTISASTGQFMGTTAGLVRVKASSGAKAGVSYVKVGAGTPKVAEIEATPLTVPANGTDISTLSIYVTDAFGNQVGSGVPLTVISSIGVVQGSSVTDSGSTASRTIYSTQAGTAIISITNLITLTGNTVITFTPGTPAKAVVSASPASLPANGTAQSILSITLLDTFNNPVGPGYNATIQTSLGKLSGSSSTNAAGILTRTLTAPLEVGTATFSVKYLGVPLTVLGDKVDFAVGPLDHVTITPTGLLSLPAGQSLTLTAQGYDVDDAPLPSGVNYSWDLSCGAGCGQISTIFGQQTTFTGTVAGTGTELVASADEEGAYYETTANITVVPGPPISANNIATPASIPVEGTSPLTLTLSNLVDNYDNVSADGTVITISVQSQPVARILTSVVSGEQAQGIITATTQAGTYPVTAFSVDGEIILSGDTTVTFTPGPPATAELLSATPAQIIADNTNTSTLVLQLRDAFGNKVAGGITPIVTSTLGTILSSSDPTDNNGVLTRTLQAGLVLGNAQVGVNGISASGSSIALIPGPPFSATVTVITSTLIAGGNSTPVVFDISDAWNHPVVDGTIITPTLSPSYGTFSGNNLAIGGLVTQTLTPGSVAGTTIIGSQNISVTGNTLITIDPAPAAVAHVVANPISPMVGNTTTLVITVTDTFGNIVPSTTITLTTTTGTLDGDSSTITKTTADSTGIISTVLSSTIAGTQTLIFEGPADPLTIDSASDAVVFLPDAPVAVTLAPIGPLTVAAGSPLTVTVSSRDRYGNAVDLWMPVNYTWQQNSPVGSPGYGTLTDLDSYARRVEFMPMQVGKNQLWATGGITTSTLLTVNIVTGPPATATIAVSPTIVPADGVSTYTFTLTNIVDVFDNPIPDGTPLTMTVQSYPPVAGVGSISNGMMTGILPSSTQAGNHAIVVEGLGGFLFLNGTTDITFTPGLPTLAVVGALPDTLPGDGISTSSIVVTIYDEYFNLVSDATPITVTANLGSLSGSGATVDGQVMRTLQAPVDLGTATFNVEGPGGLLPVLGDTVEFVPGPPVYASITANPSQVLADGVSTSLITIMVKDSQGFTVNTSKPAVLTVERGTVLPINTIASTGTFTATFTADTSVGLAGLAVTYDGVPLVGMGDSLELVPGPAELATISANPSILEAGSEQWSSLTISLMDEWGHSVTDGTAVTITTSLGTLLTNTNTTVGGIITRTLTPGSTVGTATFTVTADGSSLNVSGDTVEVTSGSLDHIDILPTAPVQVTAGNTVTFSAIGYDAFNNETGTGIFTWKKWSGSGNGTLSSSGVFTGITAGNVGIQASQGGIFSPIKTITVVPTTPVTAVVSATPITVSVGGESVDLTITTRDTYDNLVADGTVLNITTNLGILIGSGGVKNGVLTRTLVSDNYYGIVDVFVNGWEAAGDKPVFLPRAQVTASPAILPADGLSQSVLTILVLDAAGQPLPDGSWPIVTTSLGTLSGTGSTMNGIVTRTLTSSLTPGVAQIYVNSTLASGQVSFDIGPASVAYIEATSPYLMADGLSTTKLTITVQDAYGHVITDAGPLAVTVSEGIISGLNPTVDGVTTRILKSSTQGGVGLISVTGLSVTGHWKIHYVTDVLNGGDFEAGNLNNWTIGAVVTPTGTSLVYSATVLSQDAVGNITITPAGGNRMVRLGATTADNSKHEVSEVWLSQPVYVQPGGVTQATFMYRLLSYDVSVGSAQYGFQEWDPFEVYLNGREVLQDGYPWTTDWQAWHGPPLPSSPKDMGWKLGILDLTPYAGQVVTLEFRAPNRQAAIDNTWVYIDNINLAYQEAAVYDIFLPSIIK
ncbi:MAG: Ig-like domain-containing protein [Anaerolineae bacterium]|nr:Ig-like domain-containing protein [Anaerolineae bacterium]